MYTLLNLIKKLKRKFEQNNGSFFILNYYDELCFQIRIFYYIKHFELKKLFTIYPENDNYNILELFYSLSLYLSIQVKYTVI